MSLEKVYILANIPFRGGKLEVQELPPKVEFYSKLNAKHISDEDYNHAVQVWNHFKIKSFGEYSDLYLKIDVLLLCDVFESFRLLCLSSHNLDCAHYLTVQGFAFDAMLYCTSIELELLNPYEKYLFFENAIKGGYQHVLKNNQKPITNI